MNVEEIENKDIEVMAEKTMEMNMATMVERTTDVEIMDVVTMEEGV